MLSLVVNGQTMNFNSGYDMWLWSMLNKPSWLLSEKMTDHREVADVLRLAKTRK